jgi:hypothetical protein
MDIQKCGGNNPPLTFFTMLAVVNLMKEIPDAVVKLLPCDYEVMGSSLGNSLLQKCREKTSYIGPKVVGPFLGPCASRSYVHWAAFFLQLLT